MSKQFIVLLNRKDHEPLLRKQVEIQHRLDQGDRMVVHIVDDWLNNQRWRGVHAHDLYICAICLKALPVIKRNQLREVLHELLTIRGWNIYSIRL